MCGRAQAPSRRLHRGGRRAQPLARWLGAWPRARWRSMRPRGALRGAQRGRGAVDRAHRSARESCGIRTGGGRGRRSSAAGHRPHAAGRRGGGGGDSHWRNVVERGRVSGGAACCHVATSTARTVSGALAAHQAGNESRGGLPSPLLCGRPLRPASPEVGGCTGGGNSAARGRTVSRAPFAETAGGGRGRRLYFGGPTIRGGTRPRLAKGPARGRLAACTWRTMCRSPPAQLPTRCTGGMAASGVLAAPHSVAAGTATALKPARRTRTRDASAARAVTVRGAQPKMLAVRATRCAAAAML